MVQVLSGRTRRRIGESVAFHASPTDRSSACVVFVSTVQSASVRRVFSEHKVACVVWPAKRASSLWLDKFCFTLHTLYLHDIRVRLGVTYWYIQARSFSDLLMAWQYMYSNCLKKQKKIHTPILFSSLCISCVTAFLSHQMPQNGSL